MKKPGKVLSSILAGVVQGAVLGAVMFGIAVSAYALSPVPEQPPQPELPGCVSGTPLVGYALDEVDRRAVDAGYRLATDVRGDVVRKYVHVDEDWNVTTVVLSSDFVSQCVHSLLSDEPGAIHGYWVSVQDGMVTAENDFVSEWFCESEVAPDSPVVDAPDM